MSDLVKRARELQDKPCSRDEMLELAMMTLKLCDRIEKLERLLTQYISFFTYWV